MNITRTTALTARHFDLGGDFQEYIRMAVPMHYASDISIEHNALREHAGLFDLTPFLKFHVRGKDALAAINHAMPNDFSKMKEGQAKYGLFLREDGTICDDGIVFSLGNDEYYVVHGDGCARSMVEESAKGRDATVTYDSATHLLSLQGPKSCDVLAPHVACDLRTLKYFQVVKTEIFGYPCTIARCGYSGERGYEVYCAPYHAVDIWDKILENGKQFGVVPCSLSVIFPLRLEAGLVWRRFDLMEQTPWEVDMGWLISDKKEADYRGKEGVIASKGKERVVLAGLVVDINKALSGGEKIYVNGEEVGTVNGAPAYSSRMQKSLAWSKIKAPHNAVGTKVEIKDADGNTCTATVTQFSVYDPEKLRTKAM